MMKLIKKLLMEGDEILKANGAVKSYIIGLRLNRIGWNSL
jgi:hypothetical protein